MGITRDSAEGKVNDVKAATKVWIESIISQFDLNSHPLVDVRIFEDSDSLRQATTENALDIIVLRTEDYFDLGGSQLCDSIFAYEKHGSTQENYLLLVRRDSGITSLGDLAGKSVVILGSIRTSLAEHWLNHELRQHHLPALRQLAGSVDTVEKPTRCVHGVFFRKNAACIVPALSYRTICELNPQIERDLMPIATSPMYVPSLIGIRRGYSSEFRPVVERAIAEVHKTPRGEQILTVYMIDRLVRISTNELESARALLRNEGEAVGGQGEGVAP